MAQLMPLPLTISCSSKSRLVLPFWCQPTRVVPDKIQEGCKTVVCVCVCCMCVLNWKNVFIQLQWFLLSMQKCNSSDKCQCSLVRCFDTTVCWCVATLRCCISYLEFCAISIHFASKFRLFQSRISSLVFVKFSFVEYRHLQHMYYFL